MKKQQIRDWFDNKVIFETEVEDSDPNPVLTAVNRARLDRARLDGASLVGASLDGARLDRARLDGASLDGASLDGARLDGASLVGASLVGASLDGASLDGASLDGASLVGASLVGASLVGASLDGARLDRARLDGASLDGASLDGIRADFHAVLDRAPNEVIGLLSALRGGRIDGSCYEGECACLLGTIANVRHCGYKNLGDLKPDSDRPAERWFLAIKPGVTPQWHPVARITERWILEWTDAHGVHDPRIALRAIAGKAIETADVTGDELRALGRGLLELLP